MKKTLLFVASCALVFSSCGGSSSYEPTSENIMEITTRVADWQIETFEDQGVYRAINSPRRTRDPYHDLEWHPAAFYAGLSYFTTVNDDPKYLDWLVAMGDKHGWTPHQRMYHADDHAVGQFYTNLYNVYGEEKMIAPMLQRFDEIMESEGGKDWQWTWCDALFMAPPVWTRLAKITGESKYLDYMDSEFHRSYDSLFSQKDKFFFRDLRYIDQHEENGESLYWARGNGWVFGGLAYMVPDFPENWEGTQFYIDMYKDMAAKLKEVQRTDGTWSAGLLGGEDFYDSIETSGTSFFVFGFAWGMNEGIIDRETYEPVMMKAWEALVGAVTEEGMLGYVQPVGAAPAAGFADYTELYGSGAFIAAGSEMYKFMQKFYPGK